MRRRLLLLFSFILCLSVLSVGQLSFIDAETSDSFAGHWYVWEENVNISGNQWISYQNVLILTNDPLAMGQIQVNNTTSGPNNFVQTLDFAGTYTFYSHRFEQPFTVTNGLMPSATNNGRAFTTYTAIQSAHNVEVVQLSSTQIQSLISAINSASSYDDTDLLNALAVINGVLDNIETATTATASDIAALNTTASNIYTALQNIDNALDTISWDTSYFTFAGYTSDFVSFVDNNTINNVTNYYAAFSPTSGNNSILTTNHLFKINVNADARNVNNNIALRLIIKSGNSTYTINPLYRSDTRYNHTWYFTLESYNIAISNPVYVALQFQQVTKLTSVPNVIGFISNNDVEYWQLRQSFALLQAQQNQQTIIINQQNQNNYQQQPYDNDNNTNETDEINGFIIDYDNKLGFIGQTFDFITSLFGVITSADESATIPFPGVTVPIGENGSNVTLLAAQNVPIVPQGLSSIFDIVKLANSMICVCAVFNMAINKYKEWSMK